jgi:hypothetical protein
MISTFICDLSQVPKLRVQFPESHSNFASDFSAKRKINAEPGHTAGRAGDGQKAPRIPEKYGVELTKY